MGNHSEGSPNAFCDFRQNTKVTRACRCEFSIRRMEKYIPRALRHIDNNGIIIQRYKQSAIFISGGFAVAFGELDDAVVFQVAGVLFAAILLICGYIADKSYHKNPFISPVLKYTIDISHRRQPSYEECIDEWLIEMQDADLTDLFYNNASEWINECNKKLSRMWIWKKHRTKQLQEIGKKVLSPDYPMFNFSFTRRQTRYKQVNYIRHPYVVYTEVHAEQRSLNQLLEIVDELEEIDFETTRVKYHAKNQRKLMTVELRERIKLRDNYTCQNCGKYMPDSVGLHIDHIIPLKEGGKTVESNLQVLCDKCNHRKGAKAI